jgi:two-component system phosphate regulon sensor histidine kinase PhoR
VAFRQLSLALLLAWCTGWILGNSFAAIALTLGGFLGWHWYQLHRMRTWLLNQKDLDPPEGGGIWGLVFDDIYHLQRRQQKSKSRLKAVIQRIEDGTSALKDGVLMVNDQGNLEWWNAAASKLLGLKESQDLGQPITNLVRAPEFKAYFNASHYSEPLELPAPTNNEVQLQFQITLYSHQDRLILCRDVSRIKQLEAMRQDFVANASHELSTPLTVISGYLETFIDHLDTLPPHWARALKQMHQQSGRMEGLIEDLLMLSRLETTQLKEHSSVDVPQLLNTLQLDAIALSNDKKHHIEVEAQWVNMLGVSRELSSAFGNLIFNAVKYTQAQGAIKIRWWQDAAGLHLSVTDNGLGIDSPHIPRLTERFYRADASRHAETGGTGLGLAIVKHVLLRHEGHLQIESTLGKGSCFTCHFPLTRTLDEPAKAQLN